MHDLSEGETVASGNDQLPQHRMTYSSRRPKQLPEPPDRLL